MEVSFECSDSSGSVRRATYICGPETSLWAYVWLFLSGTDTLLSPRMSMDLIAGRVRYNGARVDLMCQQPDMTIRELGVKDGGVVVLENLRVRRGEPAWPSVPVGPGVFEAPQGTNQGIMRQDDVVIEISDDSNSESDLEMSEEVDSEEEEEGRRREIRAVINGYFKCDFEGCKHKENSWLRMLDHFTGDHEAQGYCCPHPGCTDYFTTVGRYEKHLKEAHDGMVLPRHELSRKETRRRMKLKKLSKICDVCSREFHSSRAMLQHKEICHSSRKRRWICHICQENPRQKKLFHYTFNHDLKRHLKNKHPQLTDAQVAKHMDKAEKNVVYEDEI